MSKLSFFCLELSHFCHLISILMIKMVSPSDYKCHKDTQFQCANGICINKDLVCDGDNFCIDGSDEKNCKCLSNQFSCSSGECVTASQLCNGIKDCKDGSDESQCSKCYKCLYILLIDINSGNNCVLTGGPI